jgi:hypothetical protein
LRSGATGLKLVAMIQTQKMVALAMLAAAILPACGDDPASTCGKVQPCGGDVVGNYDVSAACATSTLSPAELGFNCPEATVGRPTISTSGSASFNADLTYTMMTTSSGTAQVNFPPACLSSLTGGLTLTCDQINDLVPLLIASMPDTLQSATCGGGDTCTCTVTTVPRTVTESGSYSTTGTTLTRTLDTGGVLTGQYCAQGNSLHFMVLDSTMPTTILADTVLTKR